MRRILIALLTVVVVLVSACGSQQRTGHSIQRPFNDADVAFATDMIPHHAQALSMVEMTWNRELDPAVAQLRDDILAVQQPEVEVMAGWLERWGKTVPETGLGHDLGAMSDHSMSLPGMMSDQRMTELDKARGADFQVRWLTMMAEHHRGAVDVAQREIDRGKSPKALALARSIKHGQTAEIKRIERLLR